MKTPAGDKLTDESSKFNGLVLSLLGGSQDTDFEQSFIPSSESKQWIK